MSRESVYDIVKNNYNLEREIRKINDLLTYEPFFSCTKPDAKPEEKQIVNYRFFDFADRVLFNYLPFKGTCLSLFEFMNNADAVLEFGKYGNLSEYRITNYLEIVENLLNMYFRRYGYLKKNFGFDYYEVPYKQLMFLVDEMERHLGVSRKVTKDRVLLVERK